LFGQEAGGDDVVVKFPVDDWGGDDREEADEEEDTGLISCDFNTR
jgi:hypothetical protein